VLPGPACDDVDLGAHQCKKWPPNAGDEGKRECIKTSLQSAGYLGGATCNRLTKKLRGRTWRGSRWSPAWKSPPNGGMGGSWKKKRRSLKSIGDYRRHHFLCKSYWERKFRRVVNFLRSAPARFSRKKKGKGEDPGRLKRPVSPFLDLRGRREKARAQRSPFKKRGFRSAAEEN